MSIPEPESDDSQAQKDAEQSSSMLYTLLANIAYHPLLFFMVELTKPALFISWVYFLLACVLPPVLTLHMSTKWVEGGRMRTWMLLVLFSVILALFHLYQLFPLTGVT